MPVSAKKRASNDKYNAKCDSILLRPIKEDGARIRAAAAKSGKSLQRFILDAVLKELERDAAGAPDPDGIQAGQEEKQ